MKKRKNKCLKTKKTKKGLLIVFEGIDGAGKTTQARRSFNHLREMGLPVKIFREPTEGYYGKIMRKILSGEIPRRSPEEELALFIEDRKEDVIKNILPALGEGEIVLIDRYYYSTIAYQGAMGLDIEAIRECNQGLAPLPDLVLIFLINVEKGLERIKTERQAEVDNYEKGNFLIRVDQIFRSLKDPNIRFINAERPLPLVNKEVDTIIGKMLGQKGYI